MNIVGQFLIFTLYYSIVFDYYVVCRISNKRRCVNADCSVPISLATTLIRYNADDERLLSFPRNVKATIYSKEAGDNPSLWGAEADISTNVCVNNNYQGSLQQFYDICQSVINGKRGYVPKDLLRENKLLVKRSDVKVIVSTGRDDKLQQNVTQDVISSTPSPDSLHTPELTGANSKGFFSMMGVVSADSVPPNSPDINPQSAKQYEVIDGTTVYPDLGSENVNTSPEAASEVKGTPIITSVPSFNEPKDVEQISAMKNPEITRSDIASEQTATTGNLQPVMKSESLIKTPDVSKKEELLEAFNAKSAGSVSESGILGDFIKGVSDLISSGSGANENELEEEEGNEDEDPEDEDPEDEENNDEEDGEEDAHNADLKNTQIKNEAPISNAVEASSENVNHSQNEPENISKAQDLQSLLNQNLTPENTIKDVESDHDGKHTSEELTDTVDKNIAKGKATYHIQANDLLKPGKLVSSESTISESVKLESEMEKEYLIKQVATETSKVDILNGPVKQKYTEKPPETNKVEIIHVDGNEEVGSAKPAIDETVNSNISSETLTKSDTTVNTFVKFVGKETEVKPVNEETETSQPLLSEEKESSKQPQTSQTETVKQDELTNAESRPEMQHVHVASGQENLSQPTTTVLPPIFHAVPLDTSTDGEILKYVEEVKEKPDVSQELTKDSSKEESTDDVANIPVQEASLHVPSEDTLTTAGELDVTTEMTPNDSSEIPPKTQEEITPFNEFSVTPTIVEKDVTNLDTDVPSDGSSAVVHEGVTTESDVPAELLPEESSEIVASVEEEVTTELYVPAELLPDELSKIVASVEEGGTTKSDDPTESLPDEPSEIPSSIEEDITTESAPDESSEGMFDWLNPLFDLFATSESNQVETEVSLGEGSHSKPDSLGPSLTSYVTDETCLADGIGEEACEAVTNVPSIKDLTWKESLYYADVSHTLELLDKIPMETTIWLIVTAVAVLLFSLGHYYIEAHRRDGPLVAVINKLEREVLILKKEGSILEDRLNTAQQQLEVWNINASENDALIVELKEELEETKAAKAELEDQVAVLEREVEAVTESGLEMHRLLSESLSSQDGSQVLLSTVETLKEKLEHQEEEIVGLSESLSHKNMEVEELEEKLVRALEVTRSLEDKIIAITRDKEEETLQLKDKHRQLIAQLEEVMETKALDETRVSTEISNLRLIIEELQKTLAEKDSELDVLKEVVKQLRSTDSNDKMDALFDVVGIRAKLQAAVTERDEYREKFLEEEGARKLMEGHMKKITQEVAELKNSFETAEKDKIEALTKLQVLSNYFKEKESQLQKELGLQESMWLQKQSDDHTIYEQMRSLREENEKYKLQNESLKKEIVEQESSFKIQLANTEQKAHENWVASRQAERRLKEVQQEAAQLRNRLTMEKNAANYSLDDGKQNISESNGDPSSPPPSLMFPPTTSPPFMMYPPPGDFVPPPPLMGSPYPSDSRPPPLGRISSPPLDHRFSPPPPLPYPPYDYPPYGHHSPSPPLPMASHHRNVHKPQPREMSREQKDHVMSNYSPEADKTIRRNKR